MKRSLLYSVVVFSFHILPLWAYLSWAGFRISILGLLELLIVQAISLFLSMTFVDLLLGLLVTTNDLPAQTTLRKSPRVAILYLTCDDLISASLTSLFQQEYPQYDVFVLDDSRTPEGRRKVDAITKDSRAMVIRREQKSGYKAGNLNHWLRAYGDHYTYVIIADCDSLLPSSFVRAMVGYAEHPANRSVAVFQSKTLYWNTDDLPARLMIPAKIISDRLMQTLGHMNLSCSFVGHNCLIRTAPLNEMGGFPEEYVAEDFALQLCLDRDGYSCRMVDALSYEAYPCDQRRLRQRAQRWAAQTLELLKFPVRGLSPNSIVALLRSCFYHLIWVYYFVGLLLIFGALAFCDVSIEGPQVEILKSWLLRSVQHGVIVIPLLFFMQIVMRGLLAIRLGASVFSVIKQWFWGGAEAFFLMAPIALRVVSFCVRPQVRFHATYSSTGERFLLDKPWTYLWFGFWLLAMVAIIRQPLVLAVNSFWLIPVVLSPVILLARKSRWISRFC